MIFDFDGTLVASAPAKRQAFFDIFPAAAAPAVAAVLAEDPDGSRHRVIPRMIEGARELGVTIPEADYVTRYGQVSEQAVAVAPELPGATSLLQRLSSAVELHVCSNTPKDTVRRHVAARGWNAFLTSIEGYPTVKRERIAAVIAARKLDPARVAMVGDGISDEEAAQANACAFFRIAAPEDLMRAAQYLEMTDV